MALSQRMSLFKLIASYILDWVIIICIAAVGYGISKVSPFHRPFSLLDLAISYPYVEAETVSTSVLAVVSLVVPALIIFVFTAVLVPWPGTRSRHSHANFWSRKAWEFNAGWMGLGLSYALAFFVTQGIKNLIGKPRPDFLARCQPDVSSVTAHIVGGYGQDISDRWTLVNSSICTQTNLDTLNEGFRSFLSGHSSASWAGLLYLSLWLASKLNFGIPYFHPQSMVDAKKRAEIEMAVLPTNNAERQDDTPDIQPYDRAAAPPLFGVILFLIPVCAAFYICSTRYVDFKHQGIDIFSGSVLGIASAWVGFRLYHGSLTRGEGWVWSPRSVDKAFAVSSGVDGWVGPGMSKRHTRIRDDDPESATAISGTGSSSALNK